MKKWIVACAAVAMVIGTSAMVHAKDGVKPTKGLIVGDIIELSTYAIKGHNENTVEATRSRIEQGFPAAILDDETGEIYVAVYKNPAPASALEKGNSHLLPFVGMKVVAQGLIYKVDGVNCIRMNLVSEY